MKDYIINFVFCIIDHQKAKEILQVSQQKERNKKKLIDNLREQKKKKNKMKEVMSRNYAQHCQTVCNF